MTNKQEISKDEQKKIAYEILKYAKKVCNENNLKYYLAGGTLLGAIRHKGFIPWDDDVDITLPFEDYKKLLEILKNDDNYILLEPYNNDNYFYTFSKLVDKRTCVQSYNLKPINDLGVCIDIFPLNNLCNTYEESVMYLNKIKKMSKGYWRQACSKKYYFGNFGIFKKMIKAIVYFPEHILFNYKKEKQRILDLMEEKNSQSLTKYIGYNGEISCERDIFEADIFDKTIEVQFEDELFSVPAEYDRFLSHLYGDYMKLPPEEDRHYPHESDCYWK